MANALPDCFWHKLQWHREIRSGSGPLHVTRSCPQLHEAVRVLVAEPWPVLGSPAPAFSLPGVGCASARPVSTVPTSASAPTPTTDRLEYSVFISLSLFN